MSVPDLPHGVGSWAIVSRETGWIVLETFSRTVAEKVNQEKYEVITILDWLVRFNRSIK